MLNVFLQRFGGVVPRPKRMMELDRGSIAARRIFNLSFFNTEDYSRRYPDIGQYDPIKHFLNHGAGEGRIGCNPLHLAKLISQAQERRHAEEEQQKRSLEKTASPSQFAVFVSSLGNNFMKDIARSLALTLRCGGHTVVELDENHPLDEARPTSIFVAPHEFFFLGRGREWVRDDVLSSAFMYCTEQPQTQWFWQALPLVLMARGVLDISSLTASLLNEALPAIGVRPSPAERQESLDEGYRHHPLLRARRHQLNWGGAQRAWSDRPLDVSFMGAGSDNRDDFFRYNADRLSEFECFLYLRQRNAGRVLAEHADQIDLSAVGCLIARNSKIALNLHRDEFPYFEWHRMVYQAMSNGALVLSEPCLHDDVFVPGVHFLTEESRYMGQMIDWLLRSDDGQKQAEHVVSQASYFLEKLDPAEAANRIANFVASAPTC